MQAATELWLIMLKHRGQDNDACNNFEMSKNDGLNDGDSKYHSLLSSSNSLQIKFLLAIFLKQTKS